RAYAWLEIGIGISGIIILAGMPVVGSLYSQYIGYGLPGILMRGLVAAVCLVPPTVLMGATLPVIARSVDSSPGGVGWLALFYGGNLFGAVCGCLLAGFYLLRVHDSAIATYCAVGLNLGVALLALVLAFRNPHVAPFSDEPDGADAGAVPGAWRIYLAIGLSGLCALGAEVIWTRLLSLMLGGTVYTFSLILAVFLIGLGIGSDCGARLRRSGMSPDVALGLCQLLLVAAMGWAAWQLAYSLPYWPVLPTLSRGPGLTWQIDLVRCLWTILPAAALWGASFPLALAAVASPAQDPARLVGRIYAANTLGAIVGAVAFSTVIIGAAGTQRSQQLLLLLALGSCLLILLPSALRTRSSVDAAPRSLFRRLGSAALILCAAAPALAVVVNIPPVSGALIADGRTVLTDADKGVIVYQGEGLNSSVAVKMHYDGTRSFHVSGKAEASSAPQDMRLQKMLAHIPALLHPRPRSVLVVGCGAGVTAGAFLTHPDVERIVICEIEPLVPRCVATYFRNENYNVIDDPRVRVENDDARHFILTTNETFDIITSDPIHPWVKGAAMLYTTEYFELCRKRLNPGGMITQWVPLYESSSATVKSELATLFSAFPEASIWGNDSATTGGYDVVALAQDAPLKVDVDEIIERLKRDDYREVSISLATVGFLSVMDLLARFGGLAADLAPWLEDAQLNHDRNLRLQYLAGWGLSSHREGAIYDEILKFRRFTEKTFTGSDLRRQELKVRLDSNPPERGR
ncbi:MAG TPA: fused MFS/spermidine synthase, partial [Planctomycetaceae bacterium]|nr:fused MFS/spermidine synthase [Planctomycetaceae bacterium]